MAARLRKIESGAGDYEQALQQFINPSPWDEQAVLDGSQRWIGRRFGAQEYLVLDDTGFPKQGTHSVGVARQYTGTLGKVASCQVAVTLQMATLRGVVALDAELYLPQSWVDDRKRMTKSGVPECVGYQPKWQLALTMIRRALSNGLSGVVLADSAFGTVTEFRTYIPEPQRPYARSWHDKPAGQQRAVNKNRRRMQRDKGKSLSRQRSELVERSFAHVCDTGGARRSWLRGETDVAKRYLNAAAGRNLSRIRRKLYGNGKPRGLQGFRAVFCLVQFYIWGLSDSSKPSTTSYQAT